MGLQWQVFAEMTKMIPNLIVHNEKLAHSKVKYSKKKQSHQHVTMKY